jgi:hypothetical protein
MGSPGTTQGCRCAVCKAASAAARSHQRATQKTQPKPKSNVVALPSKPQPVEATVGRNEAGVIAQCANSKLTETHPTAVEQCRTLARILDIQDLQNMHPATSRQLDCLLKSLDSPKRKMKSHLATVSAMAGRRQAQ